MRPRNEAATVLAGVAAALLASGCASGPGLLGGGPPAPTFRQAAQSVATAAQALAIGSSTRADVEAALGPAETLRFESGYEVWVYRAKGARTPQATPELVILFSPQGVVKKVRARPASAAPEAAG